MSRKRSSPIELSGSGIVMDMGSPKTVDASSKLIQLECLTFRGKVRSGTNTRRGEEITISRVD